MRREYIDVICLEYVCCLMWIVVNGMFTAKGLLCNVIVVFMNT